MTHAFIEGLRRAERSTRTNLSDNVLKAALFTAMQCEGIEDTVAIRVIETAFKCSGELHMDKLIEAASKGAVEDHVESIRG